MDDFSPMIMQQHIYGPSRSRSWTRSRPHATRASYSRVDWMRASCSGLSHTSGSRLSGTRYPIIFERHETERYRRSVEALTGYQAAIQEIVRGYVGSLIRGDYP